MSSRVVVPSPNLGQLQTLKEGTPIIPVMLHEAHRAQEVAAAFIRTEMSAALTDADVDFAIAASRMWAGRWEWCEL